MARRTRIVSIKEKPAQIASEEVVNRFAKATAVLIRIADRLEREKLETIGQAEKQSASD